MSNTTLTRQIFWRIAPIIVLAIMFVSGFAFYSARSEINHVYDAQLISNANVLWTLVADELKESAASFPIKIEDIDLNKNGQLELNDDADDYADSRMFRVWKGEKIAVYSDTALPESIIKQSIGFSRVYYRNEEWRIYHLPIPETDISVEVGERTKLRKTLVINILLNLIIPLLILVPIIGSLIWLGINSGLGKIRYLVGQIRSRSTDDLSYVDTEGLPKDLSPLGKALNQLFSKLEHSFTAEKRFTDHAAHQLRTPQATIKLQLQMLRQASSDKEKEEIIDELVLSNERSTKLTNMLLTSARLSHQPVSLLAMPIYPAIASVMAELGMLAKNKRIEMSLESAENATALADEALFRLMMSNLVENAIKYTPAGGNVLVRIEQQGEVCKISISDTGCGIPEEKRALVFERFYRIDTLEAEGSGLGLAMVAEIVNRFSGSIELKTPDSGTGLLVEVTLPAR